MRILITHNNFPAQFRHIAEYLGRANGHEVVFATKNPRKEWEIPGVTKAVFTPGKPASITAHPLSLGFDECTRHGAALLKGCLDLKKQGFIPDVILGHSGWGQTLFLRDAFPNTPFIGYFEWYYNGDSAETHFDGNARTPIQLAQLRMRNTCILHDLTACSTGIAPTAWQRSQFPPEFQPKIKQVHDGIDTRYFAPLKNGRLPIEALDLPNADLTGAKEIVTYCSRGMEPYRGFPQFYKALPAILEERPDCHVIIVGEDRVCYSSRLPNGKTYLQAMREKVSVDDKRVHFTGPLPYGKYKQVLQASSAHVYLTWPFVLSWSLLEALACGCMVVASDTEPVREVITHEKNGLLTSFHSPQQIAESTIDALARQDELASLREQGRETVLERYCLSKCLPVHLKLLSQVAKEGKSAL